MHLIFLLLSSLPTGEVCQNLTRVVWGTWHRLETIYFKWGRWFNIYQTLTKGKCAGNSGFLPWSTAGVAKEVEMVTHPGRSSQHYEPLSPAVWIGCTYSNAVLPLVFISSTAFSNFWHLNWCHDPNKLESHLFSTSVLTGPAQPGCCSVLLLSSQGFWMSVVFEIQL